MMVIAMSAIMVAPLAAPAMADEPEEISFSFSFPAINPCTGNLHTATENFDIRQHNHNGNVVATIKRTGFTSDGYVNDHGVEIFTENPNVGQSRYHLTYRHADGSAFQVHRVLVYIPPFFDDITRVDTTKVSCIQSP